MKRRTWLLGTAAATGALVVGWGLLPARSRLGSGALMLPGEGDIALNGWIKITPDGAVVLAMPRSEMGQGVHTALPMLAAEELDVPLASVRIEQASADAIYGNVALLQAALPFHPLEQESADGFGRVRAGRWLVGKLGRELGINATGGSTSVVDAWEVVRAAAATARASLLGAASLQWRLPLEELRVKHGVVSHAASGRSAGYGELARFAAATPPGEVRLKDPKEWTLIGTPAPRLDLAGKVDGSARFGIDVRLPGMKFAVVRMCPMIGGSPGRVDTARALAMQGVERVVMLPGYASQTAGFAVVADGYWHAKQAAQAVDVEWRQRAAGALDSRRIERALEEAVRREDGFVFYETGDATAAQRNAPRTVEAWYRAPFVAHATLEPMNCTARVIGRKVELWAPTQVPQMCRDAAARVAGVRRDDVTVHVTYLGGGFGRRLEVDYAAQATRVAMDCEGVAVQLIWPREEDTTHDYYRPMHVARLSAALDDKGRAQSLRIKSAGDSISPRWIARAMPQLAGPIDLPDKTDSEGLFDLPYGFAHQRIEHVATRMDVPVGFWRSVGHSHNAFFSESFMDELAAEARQNPLEFRRALLSQAPRHLAVLELAAEKSGWGTKVHPGRAQGIALHESFDSIVAQVAEVSLEAGRPRVHRVVCAIDCGVVVNPGIVSQQMEGAVVWALSAALHSRIDIHDGVVQQGNFPQYPVIGMSQAPHVETWIVPSRHDPGGVGEAGVAPLAPAVANALFVLTGERRRSLPLLA
ncbi:MAG TPA: xanthine dehydrogenase family protein molybdopterin-binding subunit [Ramlibacter sp.]|uniref:xanthine dehydrogenase family protein molybdopterin-binding subunit n=1 Tax=Ramlibacter sp. TaxID=1917967 RepID=UPI002C151530|nr:xanthine dehydrogenase family protein molybdopterin-binding subunit [Ramlibacter sp.]HVZ44116.1 xanthine dehydrogenase family protein molybdopterin-binding subunit [Ramlibacter sp.]